MFTSLKSALVLISSSLTLSKTSVNLEKAFPFLLFIINTSLKHLNAQDTVLPVLALPLVFTHPVHC